MDWTADSIVSVGFWSALIERSQDMTVQPGSILRITNICFADTFDSSRTALTMSFTPAGLQDAISVNCGALTARRVEHIHCDLFLDPGNVYTFRTKGCNTLQLYGSFIADGQVKPLRTEMTWSTQNHHEPVAGVIRSPNHHQQSGGMKSLVISRPPLSSTSNPIRSGSKTHRSEGTSVSSERKAKGRAQYSESESSVEPEEEEGETS